MLECDRLDAAVYDGRAVERVEALEARAGVVEAVRVVPWRATGSADLEGNGQGTSDGFTLGRWRRNREYEALLGVAAAFLLLAAKMLWM